MAPSADDQGLATAGSHHLDPVRFLSPPLAQDIGQASDVVYLDLFLRAAKLAGIGQEPFEQFRPVVPDVGRRVIEGCVESPYEGDVAPLCEKWLLAFVAFDRDARTLRGPRSVGTMAPKRR